jgi:hypothetical protein
MKTLVIHPKDRTTEFLSMIYEKIPNKTVVRGDVTMEELNGLILEHERVIMMGHGTPDGLMSVGQFPKIGSYVISNKNISLLKGMRNNVYIWCHANQFVERHKLEGFYSGMFISETYEAMYCNVVGKPSVIQRYVVESNKRFSEIMSESITHNSERLYSDVVTEYGKLSETNPVVRYNVERLRLV